MKSSLLETLMSKTWVACIGSSALPPGVRHPDDSDPESKSDPGCRHFVVVV